MEEIKSCFQPIDGHIFWNNGVLTFSVTNNQDFETTGWLDFQGEVLVDGMTANSREFTIESEQLTIPVLGPGMSWSGELTLPDQVVSVMESEKDSSREILITLRVLTKEDSFWAPKGHCIAWVQGIISQPAALESVFSVDSTECGPSGSADLTFPHPVPCLWRAPTDNDTVKAARIEDPPAKDLWLKWNLDSTMGLQAPANWDEHRKWEIGGVSVVVDSAVKAGSRMLSARFTVPAERYRLPRLGLQFTLSGGYTHITWYGRGPVESYPDRKLGLPMGRYTTTIDGLYSPYIVPGEHGHLEDVLMVELTDETGALPVLRFTGRRYFGVNCTRYSLRELTEARHTSDLGPKTSSDPVYLILDAAHRGVGTATCGPDVLPQYEISPGTHGLDLVISSP